MKWRSTYVYGSPMISFIATSPLTLAHLYAVLTAPKPFVETMWFIPNSCFYSGTLEFWYMLGRGYLRDHPQVKSLGTESLMLPWLITPHVCWHNPLLEELSMLGWLHQERSLGSLWLVSFRHLLTCVFPLQIVFCNPFTVINPDCEYDSILSPMSPSKSTNLRWSLGIPDTRIISHFINFHI